jgi:hypothetical protein
VTQTFDFIKKNDEIFNSAYKFDFNGLYQRSDGTEVSDIESASSATTERECKSSDKYRAEYNRCVSELENFYKRELEKSKKCDEIAIKYNSLIDIVNNFLKVQDAEKINAKNYPN